MTKSFARATESLGMPRTSVSTTVQQIEALVGVQMLTHTTRRLNFTVDGTAYYERCSQILADIDELDSGFHAGEERLRVEMPERSQRRSSCPRCRSFTRVIRRSNCRSVSVRAISIWSAKASIAACSSANCPIPA